MTPDQNELSNILLEKEQEIKKLYADIRRLDAEKDEAIRKARQWENYHTERGIRERSRHMTTYYMLEKLSSVGTHHEKEVVIRYLRMVLEGYTKEGDSLPWDTGDLPF